MRSRSRELESQANTDPLTGLGNLRHLQREIAQLLDLHKRYEHPFALLLMDVDGLKRINDSHGHQAGDRVLVQVAMAVRRSIRTVDIAGRIGGDEFCVLAPEQDAANALKLGERLNAAAAEEVATPDEPPVGLSIGVVSCPEHGTDAEALIDVADKAMYRAKAAGEAWRWASRGRRRDGADEDAADGARAALVDQAVADADRHGLGARGGLELRQDPLGVGAHGLGGEAEALGHGVGLHAVGQHLEDLALAGAQRAVGLVEHDRGRQARVHVELARARGLDGADQVLGGRVLAHVALDPGLERLGRAAGRRRRR